MSNRAFVFTILGFACAAFAALAAINFCVNPYAQYSTEFVEPLVQTSRAQKVDLLSKTTPRPESMLVGSSRVLKFEPSYLEQVSGETFFNAGVNYGKPEDHLAFVRLYESRFGRLPETLVIGLDVHGFNENLPTDARLLSNRELASRVPDAIPFADRFHRVKELLSWQQTMSSLRSLKRVVQSPEPESPIESFQSDGLIVYHQREQEIADGEYDFESALAYSKHEYKQLFAGYDQLSGNRLQLFLKTVATCQAGGTRVIVVMTPLHPELASYLADGTTYPERRDELKQFLARNAQKHGFEFTDCSDIAAFRGSPERFVDGIHPLEENTRRIINQLFAGSAGSSHYVVQ